MNCYTPYCDGSCEQCLANQESEREYEQMNTNCPHRKECNLKTVTVYQDICTFCNQTFEY